MGKIVLSDGGSHHRPDYPYLFSPGLRAAAHYLKAVEAVAPRVRRKLSEEVRGRRQFPSYFVGWQGLELSRDKIALDPIPGRPVEPQQERFEEALPFLERFQAWANKYYMWSPSVLDLLHKTLKLWLRIDRESDELQGSIRRAKKYGKRRPLTETDQQVVESDKARLEFLEGERERGWGWWVDFLSSDITRRDLSTWNRSRRSRQDSEVTTGELQGHIRTGNCREEAHRLILERMEGLRIGITWGPAASQPPFVLILPGWEPEVETWSDVERRFRDGFEKALASYRERAEESISPLEVDPEDPKSVEKEQVGWEAVPTKRDAQHFKWLARRQVQGWRTRRIAARYAVEPVTVRGALSHTAGLLQMEVRSGPVGRPRWDEDP